MLKALDDFKVFRLPFRFKSMELALFGRAFEM